MGLPAKNAVTVVQQSNREVFERILYKMSEAQGTDLQFLSCVLQSMNTSFVSYIPTAGVCFDKKLKLFQLRINPEFFKETLENDDERVAVMIHEIYHILHKHVFIPPEKLEALDKKRLNVSMDLTINQLIKNLPAWCWKIENLRDKNKKPFQNNLTFEEYYALLPEAELNIKDHADGQCPQCAEENEGAGNEPKDKKDTKGDSEGSESSKHGKEGKPRTHKGKGKSDKWVPAKDYLKEWDAHDWSEADIKERLDATRDLIKRAIQKNSFSYSKVPDFVQDCLEKVESTLKKLNYREMLLKALRNSLPSKDIMKTWKRPSRRYGDLAKGNICGKMPKLAVYIDTSGSISHTEANEFLKITNNFMTTGVSKAILHMFHTEMYFREQITKNYKMDQNKFQSGGTDLQPVMDHIYKTKPDLAIILTDGYYSDCQLKKDFKDGVVFIISKDGNKSHPLKRVGTTVTY